jgi:multicomponent Na+:H+ antiporter subunit G
MEWVRFSLVALFLIIGIIFMVLATVGVYRFHYVLNRMHAAAMGDTLGLLSCLVGLMIFTGFSLVTLKLLLVIVCLWIASPVASHLISRLEVTTNDRIDEDCKYIKAEKKDK